MEMISLTFVLQFPKGRCYGNPLILGAFCRRKNWSPSLFASVFDNVLAKCYATLKVYYYDNSATPCKNLVDLSAVTPEILQWQIVTFATIWQKFW